MPIIMVTGQSASSPSINNLSIPAPSGNRSKTVIDWAFFTLSGLTASANSPSVYRLVANVTGTGGITANANQVPLGVIAVNNGLTAGMAGQSYNAFPGGLLVGTIVSSVAMSGSFAGTAGAAVDVVIGYHYE